MQTFSQYQNALSLAQVTRLCQYPHAVVALTGAGISAASGLPTLSSSYRERPLRELFRLADARRHVREYQSFYAEMMENWLAARPNPAHRALAKHGIRIITQNVDGLHQKAGSAQVIELHGGLRRLRCVSCANKTTIVRERIPVHPQCGICGGLMWPDLVLEGEAVRSVALAVNWLSVAELVLIIGTKLEMYPVNRFPRVARRHGACVVTIGKPAETVIPQLLS